MITQKLVELGRTPFSFVFGSIPPPPAFLAAASISPAPSPVAPSPGDPDRCVRAAAQRLARFGDENDPVQARAKASSFSSLPASSSAAATIIGAVLVPTPRKRQTAVSAFHPSLKRKAAALAPASLVASAAAGSAASPSPSRKRLKRHSPSSASSDNSKLLAHRIGLTVDGKPCAFKAGQAQEPVEVKAVTDQRVLPDGTVYYQVKWCDFQCTW
jgi:hypothetical protein